MTEPLFGYWAKWETQTQSSRHEGDTLALCHWGWGVLSRQRWARALAAPLRPSHAHRADGSSQDAVPPAQLSVWVRGRLYKRMMLHHT